jgi:RNA polymerase sigma-70 factor, ECF subfamily
LPDRQDISAQSGTFRELFVQRLTGAQSHLYAFICSLLGGTRDARDVLQETNAVLWKKSGDYDPDRDFLTWAYTFARYQAMAYRKRISRDRLVLDEALLGRVAAAAAEDGADLEERLVALDGCVEKLSPQNRQMVLRRYRDGVTVRALAAELAKTPATLAVLLHRVRLALARCVQLAVASGGAQ